MNRPSLTDIYNRVRVDLPSTVRYSLRKIMSEVIAGTTHMLYGYIEYLASATLPDSRVTTMLNKWCDLFGIDRKPANYAEIKVQIEATEPLVIPAGTRWQFEESQVYYSLSESVDVRQIEEKFSAILTLRCDSIGEIGNRTKGEILTVEATIPNLSADAIVRDISKTGADIESDRSLRNRLISRLRLPPQGGCPYDYIAWAQAQPGVSRAWVLPRPGGIRGKVLVTYLKEKGLPSSEEAVDVQSEILKICPVTADLKVVAPLVSRLDISLDINPPKPPGDDDPVLDEIKAAIKNLLDLKATPKGYFNAENIMTPETGVIFESDIHQAISTVSREISHKFKYISGNIPTDVGQIVVMGDITRAV